MSAMNVVEDLTDPDLVKYSIKARRMVGSRKCWGPRTSRSSSGENTERAWKAARSFFSRLTIIPD